MFLFCVTMDGLGDTASVSSLSHVCHLFPQYCFTVLCFCTTFNIVDVSLVLFCSALFFYIKYLIFNLSSLVWFVVDVKNWDVLLLIFHFFLVIGYWCTHKASNDVANKFTYYKESKEKEYQENKETSQEKIQKNVSSNSAYNMVHQ